MTFAPNTAFDTDPSTRGQSVHGNGRRPEREFKPDPAELVAWTRANERARRAYYAKPNACTHAIYKGGA
jgi:hypothetical protein